MSTVFTVSNSLFILLQAVLPEKFDTPMFWEEDDLRELEGTAVVGLSLRPWFARIFLSILSRQNRKDRRRARLP